MVEPVDATSAGAGEASTAMHRRQHRIAVTGAEATAAGVPRGVGIQSRAETEARRRTALLASPAPALVASTGSTIVVELSEDPEGQLYALRCLEGLLEGKGVQFF